MRRRILQLMATAALAVVGSARADLTADQTPFHSFRGLWADRFDYSSTATIQTLFQRAQALGVTDVVFQVRGQADAYYNNNGGLEVKASGVSASYDPLGIAVTEGHARGIKVHAWINTMPLWNARQNGATVYDYTPTAPAGHLINTHPEYWIRDADNNPLPFPTSGSGYVIVNPALPEVRAHLNNVARTIVQNYAVDGLHLDYIRLYNANPGDTNALEYPADPVTEGLFQLQYAGMTPTGNPTEFRNWMADQITTLVRSIRTTVKDARPSAQLTAAVWRDADIGVDSYQQDWARWIDEGLLDAAMPMIYRKGFDTTDSGDLYRTNVAEALARRGTAGIIVGIGSYMQDDAATAAGNVTNQLTYARDQGANGVVLFDYGTLYNGTAAQNAAKTAISTFFAANSTAPATVTIETFEVDEGRFKWSPTLSGTNRNIASATADRVVTAAHGGTGAQQIVVNKTPGTDSFIYRHLSGDPNAAVFESNFQFATIGSIGFWLKTSTPDLQVGIVLDDTTTGERGYMQNVIADGAWHKYEWFLDDPTHWDDWLGGLDGHPGNIAAIDSIYFTGTQASSTILLDDVYQNAGATAPNQWTFDGNANWHHSGNWTGGVPNGVGATANLLRRGTAPRTITLGASATVGTLRIDNSQRYTIAGAGKLIFDVSAGSATLEVVNRGGHVVSAPVTLNDSLNIIVDRGAQLTLSGTIDYSPGKGITRGGDGTLTISGPQTIATTASWTLAGGTTVVDVNVSPTGTPKLDVNVQSGAILQLNQTQRLKSLTMGGAAKLAAGGTRSIYTQALTFAGGTLDLADNDMVFQPNGVTPQQALASVTAAIASARNGPGGLWSGAGLSSSTAAGQAGRTTLAVMLNNNGTGQPLLTTFAEHSVDANSVLVKYTYAGDLNFDGKVDIDDYFKIDRGMAQSLSGYVNGDIDYNGAVDGDDYFLIDAAFLGQGPALTDAAPGAVPEPGAGVVLVMAAVMLRRRRR